MTDPAEQGTHFWLMTVLKTALGRSDVCDFRGTCTPQPGETRFDLFDQIRQKVNETDPSRQGGTVLAFDIQPNRL